MFPFTFYNPVKIIFGPNSIPKITKELPINANILITYGGGSIKNNGIYDQVVKALSNHRYIEFGGIEANPDYETLMQAVQIVKEKNIDYILSVGGGSVLDGSKFIAAAAKYEGHDAWDILSKGAAVKEAIDIACIMTLPATGSEMNGGAVISYRKIKQKRDFGSPLLLPKFSVLDPLHLQSLPTNQKANGVVDTFIHVLEQYLTYNNQAEIQDRWAEGILQTLIKIGPEYVHKPFDVDIASNMMWAATSALNGIIGLGVAQDWATHMIGHEITALFGLDHAETLAIIMPGVMDIMQHDKMEKLESLDTNVFGNRTKPFNVKATILKTEEFFQNLGIKTRFSDYQIYEKDMALILNNLEIKGDIKLGEKKHLTKEKLTEILVSRL